MGFGSRLAWVAGSALALLAAPATAKETPAKPAPAAARDGKAGIDAWRRGDHATAIAIWRPLAEAGDAEAQYNLAQAYRLGRGVKADENAAMRWYERAARQGLMQAEANYGLLLLEKDRNAAFPWLQSAAAKGDPRAQYVVGTALFNGDPAPRDPVRAYAMMRRAAASGLPQAVRSLTEMESYLSPAERQRGMALADQLARPAAVAPASPRAVAPAPAPARLSQVPAPTPTPTPAPTPAAGRKDSGQAGSEGGRWRIQLGAFGNGDRAEALWRRISANNAAMAGARHYLVPAGAVVRLQAGPFASRAAAEQACVSVRASGQACFSVTAP